MKIKRSLFSAGILLAFTLSARAQVSVNSTGTSPDPSAMLDVSSTVKGILVPRMTAAQRDAISNPATGLLIYQTDNTPGFYYNAGTPSARNWTLIGSGATSGWSLTGNSGTNPSTNFIGTTDNVPLIFKTNNQPSGKIDPVNNNTSLGYNSLLPASTGSHNTAIGSNALKSNSTGHSNVAIGTSALFNSTNLSNLVALGDSALFTNYGVYNTALGSKSLYSNEDGNYNTATGFKSLYANISGQANTAHGTMALLNNSDGWCNTAFGSEALFNNENGGFNTAVGYKAGYASYDAFRNTAIGSLAGYHLTTGIDNIFLGASAGPSESLSIDSSMWLGNTRESEPVLYGDMTDGRIGIGTATPNSSAKLDIVSSSKGLLIPRMTNAQITTFGSTLVASDKGMIVFNTDDIKLEYWDGTAWKTMVTKTTTAGGSSDGTSFCSEGVTDYDGHQYKTVKIGDQCWMAENLKSTHYADGTEIEEQWAYNNDEALAHTYGRLYNWAAMMHGAASSNSNPSGVQGICPDGWHVPSDSEWQELEMTLGMTTAEANSTGYRGSHGEGRKLKETDEAFLWDVNTSSNGTNNSGFTALPGGEAWPEYEDFEGLTLTAKFWSSTESSSSEAWCRRLGYGSANVYRNYYDKMQGCSVRCLQD